MAHLGGHPAHPVAPGVLAAVRGAGVVHTHHTRSAPSRLAALAAPRDALLVTTDHGLGGDASRRWARRFDGFLPVSRYAAATLRAPPARTRVIYGGADPARFRPDPATPRAGVLFVGRLTPHKGVDRLLRALPAGAELTLAGTAGHDRRLPERSYPELLRSLAAGRSVRVAGPVAEEELPALHRRAAVFALPSVDRTCYGRPVAISELLGLSVLEAMASGTPVVASRIGGVPEVVTDGETGFLVDPGDVGGLHDRLATLLADRRLARRMGDARAVRRPRPVHLAGLRPPVPGRLRGAGQVTGARYAPKATGDSHTRTREVVPAAIADRGGEGAVEPAGEDLDGHRLGVRRPDRLEVSVPQPVRHPGEGGVEDVEVAHHAPLAEAGPAHDDLQPVVVGVELALGALGARHDVQCPHLHRGADLVPADLVHGGHVYHSAACRRPTAPSSTAAKAAAASLNANAWVASRSSRSSANRSRATARRRATVQRPASAAGMVDTWVLRMRSRRRWNSAPSGRGASLVPYHDTTRASPSWARWGRPARRVVGPAAGLDQQRHTGRGHARPGRRAARRAARP